MSQLTKGTQGYKAAIGLIMTVILMSLMGCKTYHPMEEAVQALAGSAEVSVSEDSRGIYFEPSAPAAQGFVFYPGAGVKPGAYAPMALTVAEAGFTVAVAKFPLNLAVLAANRADHFRSRYPQVSHWALGGHSLGGVMAAQYLDGNRMDEALNGLIMLAAYPGSGNNLGDSSFNALSLFASEDRLTKPLDIENTATLMPPNTLFVEIQGGNHAQFGWYGTQDGDGNAFLSRRDQATLVNDQVVSFLSRI